MKVRIEWAVRGDAVLETALADPRLSFRAKGLLAHMLSLPRGSAVDVKTLADAASEGKEAISTAMRELSVGGYCDRIEIVDEGRRRAKGESGTVEAGTPVMESLFGQSFSPPVPISELREDRQAGDVSPEEAAIGRIIDRLNELRERSWDWAHYKPLLARYSGNTKQIRKRLREGYGAEDMILILEYRAAVDGGDEKSRRYFNCDTPFNDKNFELNLSLAREWGARGRTAGVRKRLGTSRGKEYYLGSKEENP